jgi:hypothetical protein
MNRRILTLVAGLAALFTLGSAPASAQHFERIGTLDCKVAPNVSFIVGSMRSAGCTFYPNNSRQRHRYKADLDRIGIDLNISQGGHLIWAVHAHNKRLYPGDLRGVYRGASANIALGLGLGANVLVGGSSNTIALQPLSGESSIGIGISLGVGEIELH